VWTSARKSEGRIGQTAGPSGNVQLVVHAQRRISAGLSGRAPARSLLLPASMNRCDFTVRISPALTCVVALLAGCLTNEGRGPRIAQSRIVDEGEATATIQFAKGESEPAAHLPAYVEELVDGATSGSPKAVLVLGFANDHDDLNANLALAERRAQAIARELVTKGVPRDRMIVAGSETPPNDEGGSRVEVTIASGSRIAMLPATSPADRSAEPR
jgi:hypothetical protein